MIRNTQVRILPPAQVWAPIGARTHPDRAPASADAARSNPKKENVAMMERMY